MSAKYSHSVQENPTYQSQNVNNIRNLFRVFAAESVMVETLYSDVFQEVSTLKKLHKPAWLKKNLHHVDTKLKDIYLQNGSPEMKNVQPITDLYVSPLKENMVNTDISTNLPGAYTSGCSMAKCSGNRKRSRGIRKTRQQLYSSVSEPVLQINTEIEKHSFGACVLKTLSADLAAKFFTFDAFYSRLCHESQQRLKLRKPKYLHAKVQLPHDLGISHLKCMRDHPERETSLPHCHHPRNLNEDIQQELKRRTLHEQSVILPSNTEVQCSASSHKNKATFCCKGSCTCKDGLHSEKRKEPRRWQGNKQNTCTIKTKGQNTTSTVNFIRTSEADSVSKLEEPVQLPTEKSCDLVDERSNDSFISCIQLSPKVTLSEAPTTKRRVGKDNQRTLTCGKRRKSQRGLNKCADISQPLQSGRDRSKLQVKDIQHGRKSHIFRSVYLKRKPAKTIASTKSSRGKAKSLKTNKSIQHTAKMSKTEYKAKLLKGNRNCHISSSHLNIMTKGLVRTKARKRRLEESLAVDKPKRRQVVPSTKEDIILHYHQSLCTPTSTNSLFFSLTASQDIFAQLCQLEEKSKHYDSSIMHSLMPETTGNIYRRGPSRLKEPELQGGSHIGGVWKSIFSEN